MKSSDDYSNLIHSIRTGVCIDSVRPIRHTRLVKVMICRVGNIRKKGQGVTRITIKVEKIVIISHIT